MKKILLVILLFISCAINAQDGINDIYVATDGSNSNDGTTILTPLGTWDEAFRQAVPGDSVFFRGGVYYSIGINTINPEKYNGAVGRSGTRDNPITYLSYPNEWAVLDCINHCDIYSGESNIYNTGINLDYVEFIKFKDFEVRNVLQCDSSVSGGITSTYSRNLTFEHIILHDVGQRGFFIASGAWLSHYTDELGGEEPVPMPYWTDNSIDSTYFINCDAYNLCDTLTRHPGNASDAWITMSYRGNYMEWRGCRAWNYTDDGFNPTIANGGQLIIDSCWFMPGGTYKDALGYPQEQNGMKLNGVDWTYYQMTPSDPYSVISNCIAVFGAVGFYALETTGRGNFIFKNNIAYKNNMGYSITGSGTSSFAHSAEYYNNIEYGAYNIQPGGNYGGVYIPFDTGYEYIEHHNTWDTDNGWPYVVETDTVTVTDADFVSLDSVTIVNQLTAPRKADGSLPDLTAFTLTSESDLINAGVYVGTPYAGLAPDLGPFEYVAGAPVAAFLPSTTTVDTDVSVSFNAAASTDDGTIVSYEWTFGDGGTATEITTSHAYTSSGSYTVTLTVTDNESNTGSVSELITVNAPVSDGINTPGEITAAIAAASPGETIELAANSFAGDFTFDCNGTSDNMITITAANGFAPIFSGNVTITGDFVRMTNLGFNGNVSITNCQGAYFDNNTLTGPSTYVFTKPRSGSKGRDWIIDFNTYNNSISSTFNGRNFGIYQAIYNLDKHSTP